MTEVSRILDQLHRAYEGPAWHGPALREVLAGVTSQTAAQRPIPGAHTIWELVLHLTVWISVPTRRIAGAEIPTLPPDQDWPAAPEPSESGWQQALEARPSAARPRGGSAPAHRRSPPRKGPRRSPLFDLHHAPRRRPAQLISRRLDRLAQESGA